MRPRTRTAGFTLIELLVVIAIIAILAAILFPVFARARSKALQTQCLNNVKQLAMAVHMYLDDWDQFFPMGHINGYVAGVGLLPYVANNYSLYRCPTDNNTRAAGLHAATYNFPISWYGGPYGFVYTYAGIEYAENSANLTDITQPASFVIISETEDAFISSEGADNWSVEAPNLSYAGASEFGNPWPDRHYTLRHGDNGNCAFADGHARAISVNMTCTQSATTVPDNCIGLDNMYYLDTKHPPS